MKANHCFYCWTVWYNLQFDTWSAIAVNNLVKKKLRLGIVLITRRHKKTLIALSEANWMVSSLKGNHSCKQSRNDYRVAERHKTVTECCIIKKKHKWKLIGRRKQLLWLVDIMLVISLIVIKLQKYFGVINYRGFNWKVFTQSIFFPRLFLEPEQHCLQGYIQKLYMFTSYTS